MTEWNDEMAAWYARTYGDYATKQLAVEALTLGRDTIIVDVGCGTGSALRHAAATVTRGALIGVDPVPHMVEIARRETAGHAAASRIEFREGSAETVPVDDGFADVVLAFDSFDHWRDKARGLDEVRRILRPNGQFVVVKDGGLPGGKKARQAFVEALALAGFVVSREEQIEGEGVRFTIWVCLLENKD